MAGWLVHLGYPLIISLWGIYLKKGAWTPVPTGDGQKLTLRLQTYGKGYFSYSFSFTEPWLGGRNLIHLVFHTIIPCSLMANPGAIQPVRSYYWWFELWLGKTFELAWWLFYFISGYFFANLQAFKLFFYFSVWNWRWWILQYKLCNNFLLEIQFPNLYTQDMDQRFPFHWNLLPHIRFLDEMQTMMQWVRTKDING